MEGTNEALEKLLVWCEACENVRRIFFPERSPVLAHVDHFIGYSQRVLRTMYVKKTVLVGAEPNISSTGCQTAKGKGQEVTCVYCRGIWPKASLPGARTGTSGTGPSNEDGYLNLGTVAGMSLERDESSCTTFLSTCIRAGDLIFHHRLPRLFPFSSRARVSRTTLQLLR